MKDRAGIPKTEISRRNFLKIGAITAGTLASPSIRNSESSIPLDPSSEGRIDREVKSCCQFCQVRCTTIVQVRDDRVINVYGNPDNTWTDGKMCPKGQSLVELTYSPHRLLYPLKREGSAWKRISYQEALNLVAEKILKVKADFPEDYAHRVVLFAPLWESHESELAAIMALNLAGFTDICATGDTCIGNSATALRLCLGSPITTTTVDEMLNSQMVILFGANLAEMYPPYVRWLDRAREKKVRILYVDPRKTPTNNHCDMQLTGRPGTDGALVLGVIRYLITEGLYDRAYVKAHVNGFEELVAASEPYTPEIVSKITWIAQEKIIAFAKSVGQSKKTIVWIGGSVSRYTNSIQTVRAIIALQAITGNLSGKGKGIMNVQGGKPGGREEFDKVFLSKDVGPALSFRKIIYGMTKKRVNVLLLNSSYRRYPDANQVRNAISNVDFVVYRGFFMDEEAKLSHLVIPATMTFESSGSQYGAQRQVVWRNKVIQPQGEAVEDWRFYCDLGRKINKERFPDVNTSEDIFELHRKHAPSWSGITLDRLKNDPSGISWPCPSNGHPGTKGDLYPNNQFLTKDKKVELRSDALGPIQWTEPEGSPIGGSTDSKKFPLVFVQGKVTQHWQHTYTNWSAYMAQFSKGNYVQVNPQTVQGLGVKEGEWVYLETEIGKIKARVSLSELIMPGIVWTPSHPAPGSPFDGNLGSTINTIIPSYWDKVSAQFNGFGCRLRKVEG